jgi:enamine deaminase RidA (YjgF/YER057c/UK114 family)
MVAPIGQERADMVGASPPTGEMLEPLQRDDVPRGLIFTLGYRVKPGSRLVFLKSTDVRHVGRTSGGFHAQSRDCLDYLRRLAGLVSPETRIAKVRRYMTSGRGHRTPETLDIWNEAFGGELPASTALEVPGTTLFGSVVDLEGWAVAPADPKVEPLQRFAGDRLTPDAIAVRGDQSVCVAAVRPDPADSVEREAESCLSRIGTEFEQHGADVSDVAKLTVYFRDPRSWPIIEGMVFARYGENSPVVNGIIVSNLSTQGGHVEMSGWARVGPGPGGDGLATIPLGDRLLMTTGTGAIRIFVGGEAADMYAQRPPSTIEEQAEVGMQNQQKVLEAAGATFDDVFRSNFYVTDMRDWEAIEPVVESYFGRTPPVSMVVEVSRLTAKQGVRFEPDLWATVSDPS